MAFEEINLGGIKIKAWLPANHQVEEAAIQQLGQTSRVPIVKHVAVLPDVHLGKGATVGSVIATEGGIIPASVGVDIGCGMLAFCLNFPISQLPDNLTEIRFAIEQAVPHGRTNNGQKGDRGAWGDLPGRVVKNWQENLWPRYEILCKKHQALRHPFVAHHLGTLGTGNHFIELCTDECGYTWIMLHSGSRGVGNKVGSYFIRKAKEEMLAAGLAMENRDLAFLLEEREGGFFSDYIEALLWAQEYARINRDVMLSHILVALVSLARQKKFPTFTPSSKIISCHHNYAVREMHFGRSYWVTRKGAVRAEEGDLGIIPGSMGTKSFIVQGRGNKESLHSCSHGAGRVMSRTEAKRTFTPEDLAKQTAGIECRKDEGVVDEIPAAYKNIDEVIRVQEENGLIEVLHTLRQLICVKG